MANIPGISGFIQPGAFARDRVITRGVSIPGGLRIVCVMGEGLREETVVQSAFGGGEDGDSDCSPTGNGDGRFFSLQYESLVSGRTELRLNGTLLFGIEDEIDANGFSSEFDFRLDPVTGCFELQGASIGDQDGIGFSASSTNIGTGIIVEATCDPFATLDILDDSAPAERWTIRCVSVVRDSNGDPIPGLATFTATGSSSGLIYDSAGSPVTFHSSYYTGSQGAISGTATECEDGFIVAFGDSLGSGFSRGHVGDFGDPVAGDATPETSDTFIVPGGDLVSHGQALAGDYLCLDGYASGYEIDDIEFDGTNSIITVTTDSLEGNSVGDWTDIEWSIRATNLLIDDPDFTHNLDGEPVNPDDGLPESDDGFDSDKIGPFSSGDVGKTVVICPGNAFSGGRYVIEAITSTRRVRLHSLEDESAGFPDLEEAGVGTGLADSGLTFHLLENNGIILVGINEGTVPFETGDKFYVDVDSRALAPGDQLEAKYIYEGDLNDPQFFTEANDLFDKHGVPSEENTLALGAQMTMENGAPGILAIQCKPPIPRRTTVTLLEERDSLGVGGFSSCFSGGTDTGDACEVDDLRFVIPRPITGLRNGKPDPDTRVNIFFVRDGEDIQIFPNKVDFYNSQLESDIQQGNWIDSTDNSFSYTVVNTEDNIVGNGDEGEIDSDEVGVYFSTSEFDFDGAHVGHVIVITSMEDATQGFEDRDSFTSVDDISGELFGGSPTVGVELVITGVADDSKVYVADATTSGPTTALNLVTSYEDVQFFIKDIADTTNVDSALLIHKDLVTSGALKAGDGIKISYVDENDSDYFDTNWFNALEALEAADAQIMVPLPSQAISSIFRATVNHCENMSSIANRKERVAFIGAQMGVTAAALIGTEEIAVEDIGIVEGIQGDDPEEVLDGNVEDLVNFKLSDNYTSNRCVYFYPDAIVRNVSGTNILLHGFYMAAAAAGYLSSKQNVAIPLTYKSLSGFALTRDKIFRPITLNSLGNVGATVVEPVTGGGKVLAGRTTSQSGFVEDEEISIIFIRDRVKNVLRNSLKGFIGGVQSADTNNLVSARTDSIMAAMVTQGIITDYQNIRVEQDKVDPRQINVYLRFAPAYPINYIFIDIEVGVI